MFYFAAKFLRISESLTHLSAFRSFRIFDFMISSSRFSSLCPSSSWKIFSFLIASSYSALEAATSASNLYFLSFSILFTSASEIVTSAYLSLTISSNANFSFESSSSICAFLSSHLFLVSSVASSALARIRRFSYSTNFLSVVSSSSS